MLFDNLSNARRRTLAWVQALAGREVRLIEGDVRNAADLDGALGEGRFGGVVHLAGLKPGGAAADPLRYHDYNVVGTATLLARMAAHGVRTLVYVSSSAVYGGASTALAEDAPGRSAGPYGRSKLGAERALHQALAAPGWRMAMLRYFNVAGAHPGGLLGEDARHGPDSLLPRLGRVALGLDGELDVFGGSWPTADGTCVRDYVHVADVARANVAALGALSGVAGLWTLNVGTGRDHSVLETLRAFARESGRHIPYRLVGRRLGDVAAGARRTGRRGASARLAGAGGPGGDLRRRLAVAFGGTPAGRGGRVMFGPETVLLRVADDALAPQFRSGDLVYVDPDEPAAPSRFVAVAGDEPGTATVGLVVERRESWCVRGGARPEIVFGTEAETGILGVVVFWGRRV